MRNHVQLSESIPVISLLAVTGGFLESYSFICRDQIFANCQTGNLVLLAMYFSQRDFFQAFTYTTRLLLLYRNSSDKLYPGYYLSEISSLETDDCLSGNHPDAPCGIYPLRSPQYCGHYHDRVFLFHSGGDFPQGQRYRLRHNYVHR